MLFKSFFEASRNSPFKGPSTSDDSNQQLVPGRNIAAAATPEPASGDSCEFGSNKYFALCGIGGILSCGKLQIVIDLVSI